MKHKMKISEFRSHALKILEMMSFYQDKNLNYITDIKDNFVSLECVSRVCHLHMYGKASAIPGIGSTPKNSFDKGGNVVRRWVL